MVNEPTEIIVSAKANKTDPLVNEDVQLEVTVNLNTNQISNIAWDNNTLLSCNNCLNPIAKLTETTEFVVTITDLNGCEGTANVIVKVKRNNVITFPNIISIDGNNNNGTFYPIGDVQNIESVEELIIFDRWGNKVFENKNFSANKPEQGWNGIFGGNHVVPGVFVYVARVRFLDQSIDVFKGDLTVIR